MSLSKEEKLIIQNICIIIFNTLEKKDPMRDAFKLRDVLNKVFPIIEEREYAYDFLNEHLKEYNSENNINKR